MISQRNVELSYRLGKINDFHYIIYTSSKLFSYLISPYMCQRQTKATDVMTARQWNSRAIHIGIDRKWSLKPLSHQAAMLQRVYKRSENMSACLNISNSHTTSLQRPYSLHTTFPQRR